MADEKQAQAFEDPDPPAPARHDGRYLISIAQVKKGNPADVTIHDLDHGDERCNVDAIATNQRSRFNDLAWAKAKGYRPCGHCMADDPDRQEEPRS